MVGLVTRSGGVAPSQGLLGSPGAGKGVHNSDGVDLAAVRTRGGAIPPAIDFASQPPHIAGREATRLLDSILQGGGSPQLRATREAQRTQTIVFAALNPEEVQKFLDQQGLDLDPGSAEAVAAYTDAVCGQSDAELMEGLRAVQDLGLPTSEQTSVVIEGIDIVDIQLGPNAELPSVEEIAVGDPTALMDDLLAKNPGSSALTQRRQELAALDDGGAALARFDAKVLTGLSTTHLAASEDPVYAQALGLSPVKDAEDLSVVPREFRGSVLSILAYFFGRLADGLGDEIKDKVTSQNGDADPSEDYELKALVSKLEQVNGMATSLIKSITEVLKDASRVA